MIGGNYSLGDGKLKVTPYSLNTLALQAHNTAVAKGFWEGNRNPFEVLMLIVTEVSEATECVRNGEWTPSYQYLSRDGQQLPPIRVAEDGQGFEALLGMRPDYEEDWRELTPMLARHLGYEVKPVGLPSELADIIIRVLDFAAQQKIDMDAAVLEKMEYNATRPQRHGGKAA